MPEPMEWQTQAKCLDHDPELFFPYRGGTTRNNGRTRRTCVEVHTTTSSARCASCAVTTRSRPTSRRKASGVVSATASGGGSRGQASTRSAVPSRPVVQSSKMKEFLTTNRVETRVVGPIERMLLAEGEEQSQDERRQDVLHVSELAKPTFCPRAAYQRITGVAPPEESARMRLQAIFEEGHDVHAKWQRWVRRLGRLYGQWLCAVCESRWMATSPETCPKRAKRRAGSLPLPRGAGGRGRGALHRRPRRRPVGRPGRGVDRGEDHRRRHGARRGTESWP